MRSPRITGTVAQARLDMLQQIAIVVQPAAAALQRSAQDSRAVDHRR